MQSLWQHPNFLQILEEEHTPFDLRKESLHTPERLQALTIEAPYWRIQMAHQDLSIASFQQLLLLAVNRQSLNWMHAMQSGELVNHIEGMEGAVAALHTANRAPSDKGLNERAKAVWKQAREQRVELGHLLKEIQEYQTMVVLGIGGSQLGPEALYEALKPAHPSKRRVLFIPNIDPQAHEQVARELDFSKTLVVTISKSGSTLETAESERWWRQRLEKEGKKASRQMICITTPGSKLDRKADFLRVFYFDPSIGGRYSSTSSVAAVPLSFAFGQAVFEELLEGAAAMDLHALTSDKRANAPLALAALAIWQRHIKRRPNQAVIAYRQCLHRFAAHLQQLEMESLGKSTDRLGSTLMGASGALIMGEPGNCAQHSFFQWLHQGTDIVPVDFIVETGIGDKDPLMADELLANALAQSLALAKGFEAPQAYKSCPGNRPSTLICCEKLTAKAIGALLALYEHKTAFEGFILGINPFDQEGVELGKRMAKQLSATLQSYRQELKADSKKGDAFVDESHWWKGLLESH